MKRLIAVLIALAAASSAGLAQGRQAKTPTVQQVSKASPATIDPASLVGLTKLQVEAKLGKPAVALATVWSYKQPQGTLRVRFNKDGIVASAKTDADVAPAGKGYTNVDGKHVESPRKADSPPAGASAKCRDGSYSFSAHRQGTCSHHGGVAQWL
jgi:outer membrane protein assembly factor BamE (lipoprotein component of BamABCDE complex)